MSRPESTYSAVPTTGETHVSRDDALDPSTADFATGHPEPVSPLSQPMSTAPNTGTITDGSSAVDDGAAGVDAPASNATTAVQAPTPSRSSTLMKRGSMRRTTSLKRSNSKRSMNAGTDPGHEDMGASKQYNSAYSTPIPTQGFPTEILANRFQEWRQILKSLITYFREIQASYDMRSRATQKAHSAITNMTTSSIFRKDHGLGEATRILDQYHKRSIAEANKSREIEEDVIGALSGLRNDLGQKIKEIKSLSSDFKNSVDKEKDTTYREISKLTEAINLAEREDGSATGRSDPFVVKLGVDRAVERQIDEENYLHRAYLNLESSGRELESIVVGEIQKAYNALAGILKREGDDAHNTVDSLRSGPISMPKDAEWESFVARDPHFIDPNLPLRRIEDIEYPGKNHPTAAEVRSGMLERKSKYLKSYTPGWYVLSPTHLHEFKSADKIYSQPPVMSLYLPDQKLGSQSQPGSSSHKFMVKGKQSGNMHKGHNWVFRAESYDTMQAWFEDMRVLTEKTGKERDAFVRKHARSFSSSSRRASVSSDGMEEDEADQVPYSADASSLPSQTEEVKPVRPQPGGRFPSDLQVQRARGPSLGQSSTSSGPDPETADAITPKTQLPYGQHGEDPYRLEGVTAGTATATSYNWESRPEGSYFDQTPLTNVPGDEPRAPPQQTFLGRELAAQNDLPAEHSSTYGEWMLPVGAVVVGAGTGGYATETYNGNQAVSKPKTDARITGSGIPANPAESTPIDKLEGMQGQRADETSEGLLPAVRTNTGVSVSQLPVPGSYPKVA